MKRAVIALVFALLLTPQVSAHEPNRARAPDPDAPVATVVVTPGQPGGPSLLEMRLEPAHANRGELYISLSQAGRYKRRVLEPSAPGIYRLRYTFPAVGDWNVYLRYGAGQAGLVTWLTLNVSSAPGAGASMSAEPVSARFEDGFARTVPGYIQPLGYAAFLLLAVLAFIGIAVLLTMIRQTGTRRRSTAA